MYLFRKIISRIDKLTDYFLMLCLGTMGVVLFMQVIFRYILRNPLIWSEEAARYLHVWITLFGIRFGLKNNAHLSVSFFLNKFSPKNQNVIKIFTNLFIISCIIVYIPGALIFILDQKQIVSSAMGVNMGLVYVPALIGFLTTILHLLLDSIKLVFVLNQHRIKDMAASTSIPKKEVV